MDNTPFVLIGFCFKNVEVGVDAPYDVLVAIERAFGSAGTWKDANKNRGKTYIVTSENMVAVNHCPRIAYQMEQVGYTLCFGASFFSSGTHNGLSMMFRLKETPK
jgi:hypothetical protein